MTYRHYRNGVIYRQHRQRQTWAGQITFDLYCMYRSLQFLGFPADGGNADSSSSDATSDEDEDGGSDDEGSD
jgi:hypothetical protein